MNVHEELLVGQTVCKRCKINGEATIRIGHGEVFLKESLLRTFSKCLEDISDGVEFTIT